MNTVPGTPGPFTTPDKKEGHWTQSRTLLDKYDDGILNGWKDEINTQLLVVRLPILWKEPIADRCSRPVCLPP